VSTAEIRPDESAVFHRFLDLAYPNVERGEGVRLYLTDGTEILDASSGGAMVACLGHGVREIVDAAAAQAEEIAYIYYHAFTNEPHERLAEQLLEHRGTGDGARALCLRRLGGERDGAAAGPSVPRRPRRARTRAQ